MRVHVVPNSHIDPVWLWDKYEGIDEVLNTFRSACDRLDEYPHLTFSASSVQFYEWVKKYDKILFERIKKYVTNGRWEISGGWWVEPDTNLPLSISFKKHAELSDAFLMENFGKRSEVAFLPDTFGHPATLPKILSETGFKYFIFCRPSINEKTDLKHNLFYWEYEGHRVLAYRLKNHYTQRGTVDVLKDEEYLNNPVNCFFFGIGNHGGGPSIKEIEYYNRDIAQSGSNEINYSTCEAFFKDVEKNVKEIPVYSGDLHMHAVGCYSVLRELKNKIREAELILEKTERVLGNCSECRKIIESCWEKVLFNQFHDILPGSCSRAAEIVALNELGGVISKCEDLLYDYYKNESISIPVKIKNGEFRVFNSLPFDVIKPVEIEFSNISHSRSRIFDNGGNEIVKQDILPEVRTLFTKKWEFVDTIPAKGYKAYSFDIKEKIEDNDLQLEYFKDDIPESKMTDKISFPVFSDNSDTWGHGVKKYDQIKTYFEKVDEKGFSGKVSEKFYQKYKYHSSFIDMTCSNYRELPGIYIDINVMYNEPNTILKLQLDIEDSKSNCFMDCAGGAVKRKADGSELPLHNWIYCPQKKNGLLLILQGAFACDYDNGKLRINLVRSNVYGWHDPYIINKENIQNFTDLGQHTFKMLLLPNIEYNPEYFYTESLFFKEKLSFINEGYRK